MSKNINILVVDDNPAMTETLKDILRAKGYIVHAAYSGEKALETLNEQPIDILMTDVRMPDMNGVELYRETQKRHKNLITFFMTAYAADDIIRNGIAEGIKAVLDKPLDINYLVNLFEAAADAYSLGKENCASGKVSEND